MLLPGDGRFECGPHHIALRGRGGDVPLSSVPGLAGAGLRVDLLATKLDEEAALDLLAEEAALPEADVGQDGAKAVRAKAGLCRLDQLNGMPHGGLHIAKH